MEEGKKYLGRGGAAGGILLSRGLRGRIEGSRLPSKSGLHYTHNSHTNPSPTEDILWTTVQAFVGRPSTLPSTEDAVPLNPTWRGGQKGDDQGGLKWKQWECPHRRSHGEPLTSLLQTFCPMSVKNDTTIKGELALNPHLIVFRDTL